MFFVGTWQTTDCHSIQHIQALVHRAGDAILQCRSHLTERLELSQEKVCKVDYFLSRHWAEFQENARLLIFETYCRQGVLDNVGHALGHSGMC